MSDRGLVVGGTYRHWKGDLYKAIAEAKAKERLIEGFFGEVPWLDFGNVLVVSDIKKGQQIVLYEGSIKDVVFAREKEEFLEVLGDEDEGTMYYRFELVIEK